MEDTKKKFKRLEKIRMIFLFLLIFCGLIIIQFQLPNPVISGEKLQINKIGITYVAIFLSFFVLVWNYLIVKKFIYKELAFFSETIVYLLAITLVVSFSGGTYSFFNFLYFLPVLNVSANLGLKYAVLNSVIAALLSFLQIFVSLGEIGFNSSFNLYLVNLFGIFLVTVLGRFLVSELKITYESQEKVKIEQLKQLDKIKDEFVFIIAHELRSPITAIRGYLELITTEPKNKIDKELKNLLDKSFYNSNKLANTVNLLLEVARIETDKIRFYFQKIDLRNSIDFVISNAKKEIDEKSLKLTIDVEKEHLILIDKERLEEILTIILENAIQFTPEYGKILVSAQTTNKDIIVSISDNGIGIQEEMKSKIFEKLYVENKDSGEIKIQGYGISLYVCKQLLLRMNGDISFESLSGKGTTFTLRLPKYWVFSK